MSLGRKGQRTEKEVRDVTLPLTPEGAGNVLARLGGYTGQGALAHLLAEDSRGTS